MSFKKVFERNDLYEVVNIPVLKHIVKNWTKYESLIIKNNENNYDYNPKNICEKYLTNYEKVATIKYNKSSKYPSKLGRWFCKNGVGLQSLPRVISHTICDELYIDVDFVNCHPKILEQLCYKHDIQCVNLTQYIKNRDQLLDEWKLILNCTKEETKKNNLLALNGNKKQSDLPNWYSILDEFKKIHKSIVLLPEYKILLKEVEDVERTNINAKVVNHRLCIIEDECLISLYHVLDKKMEMPLNISSQNLVNI